MLRKQRCNISRDINFLNHALVNSCQAIFQKATMNAKFLRLTSAATLSFCFSLHDQVFWSSPGYDRSPLGLVKQLFFRPDAFPVIQPTASKRENHTDTKLFNFPPDSSNI